jgi:diguanylate cyclase (GGDEF)-like protein
MLHIDIFGAYVICGASSLIGAAMMKLARPGDPHMQQGLDACAWAFVFLGCGLFQFVFFYGDPPRWSILLAIESTVICTATIGWGFARFAGQRVRRATLAIALPVLGATLAVLQQTTPPLTFAAAFDAICLCTVGLAVFGIRRYLTAPRNRAELALGLALAAYWVSWLIRMAASLASHGPVAAHMLYVSEPLLTGYAILYGTLPVIVSALVLNLVNAHLHERLQAHALTDDLTGLQTRRALRGIERSALLGADPQATGVAALIVDADHFKAVNDAHGHAVGDQVLVHIAQTIRAALRAGALVTRYGGEEFVVLLAVDDLRAARMVAERLRGAIELQPFNEGGLRLALTVSVGLAVWLERESLEAALRRADDALYRAKAAGRNLVMINHELVA